MLKPEDYVTPDVAELLKKIGFNENCKYAYTENHNVWYSEFEQNYNLSQTKCSRPTLYEVQRWLREKHHIFLNVKLCPPFSFRYGYSKEMQYCYQIYHIKSGVPCSSFEKTFNEGIRECCKLIKQWDKD